MQYVDDGGYLSQPAWVKTDPLPPPPLAAPDVAVQSTSPISPTVQRFAATVRRERRLLDLSQEALAEKAGLHRNFVGKFERGETSISLDAADRLACALGFALKDLL